MQINFLQLVKESRESFECSHAVVDNEPSVDNHPQQNECFGIPEQLDNASAQPIKITGYRKITDFKVTTQEGIGQDKGTSRPHPMRWTVGSVHPFILRHFP